MNKQRLQDIANNTSFVNDNDLMEIKQLISKYPFYPLPHVVLAKIFYEKEHYLFENALTQAAMRVADREWLYHYVHGDSSLTGESALQNEVMKAPEVTEEPELADEEASVNIPFEEKGEIAESKEPEILKNDLTAFLGDIPVSHEPVSEIVSVEEPSAVIEVIEEAIETVQNIELETTEDKTVEEDITDVEIVETDIDANEDATLNMALNLRKHPVYNVEEFLQPEKAGKEESESGEKDFFYWLEHPTPVGKKEEEKQEETDVPEKDKKFSIIDQFIMANPGISRPKKEFFNAENMAKKSEQLNNGFVTETLANIYYEQGNIDLAITAYEKLSLQNPLKQTYFASLIEKIKKEKR